MRGGLVRLGELGVGSVRRGGVRGGGGDRRGHLATTGRGSQISDKMGSCQIL